MLVNYRVAEDVAVLELNSPPVNTLSLPLRSDLLDCLFRALDGVSIRTIVITARGKGFSAGADVDELAAGAALREPQLGKILEVLDSSQKPIIAAVHGMAVGGGFELAMACHYRIFQTGTLVGMPEIKLGLMPGATGTQRLPRLVGLETAANMILNGNLQPADTLKDTRLCDQLVSGDLLNHAIAYAERVRTSEIPRYSSAPLDYPNWQAYLQAHRNRLQPGSVAGSKAIDAMGAAFQNTFQQASEIELALFKELLHSRQSQALRHVFAAEKLSSKVEGLAANVPLREVARVAVIGAGTMGAGIAINFLDHEIPVSLIDITQPALERGAQVIRKTYETALKKGRLAETQVRSRMELLTTTLEMKAIGSADLIIEAVFEEMQVKEEIFRQMDLLAKSGAILASNTSSLDLNYLASRTNRPGDVIGMHFFSPANVMKLLEVVRTERTADEVLATVMSLARRIEKIPVVARVCDGFIGNRMIEEYGRQAGFLLEEGCLPQQVDAALEAFGFPMGPFRMNDLVGNDIPWKVRLRRYKTNPSTIYSKLPDVLCEKGRLGQKTGAGWYDYFPGNRKAQPSAEVNEWIANFSAQLGIKRRNFRDEEIVDRLVFALVNEAAKLLDEGIAQRASDIDVVYVKGYGFPPAKGGPLFYADMRGLPFVQRTIKQFACGRHGEYWQPAALLQRLVAQKQGFFD